jgi:hypothetical protein
MTIDEIKKMDRQLRQIPDVLGKGHPLFKKVIREYADQSHISATNVILQYTAWKWKKD